ncbi:DUF3047 domain-containing protein [Aeromonas rivuli]|uniref:DUF3047 domain-containing protein n=1 Tax=Aeromonas rivuli TaxID=648794 RepID=UPI000693BF4F|nr:DUF3047 domain-containing protein [Aeromonas rivuli]
MPGISPCFALILCTLSATAGAASLIVENGLPSPLIGWPEKSFQGHTRYSDVEEAGGIVLRAEADGSASGKFLDHTIDLNKTPILSWRWKVATVADGHADERSKAGDDYPARLYLVVKRGLFGLSSKAINYVWSAHQPLGSHWPNAFTEQAIMLSVESGPAHAGQWVSYRRDVRADLARLLGEPIDQIDSIAIMTDSDNGGGLAQAWYGDIRFSAR